MAKSIVPTDWIANYTSDGTNITIPIASLTGLTQAQAHTSTGNIVAIMLALLNTIYNEHASLAAADKLDSMTPARSDFTNSTTAQQTRTFSIPIVCTAPTLVPIAES